MNFLDIAARVAARKYDSHNEYSVQTEITLSANFEGKVSKPTLIKKLKSEIMASLESAVKITARELRLESTGLTLKPVRIDVGIRSRDDED